MGLIAVNVAGLRCEMFKDVVLPFNHRGFWDLGEDRMESPGGGTIVAGLGLGGLEVMALYQLVGKYFDISTSTFVLVPTN